MNRKSKIIFLLLIIILFVCKFTHDYLIIWHLLPNKQLIIFQEKSKTDFIFIFLLKKI